MSYESELARIATALERIADFCDYQRESVRYRNQEIRKAAEATVSLFRDLGMDGGSDERD